LRKHGHYILDCDSHNSWSIQEQVKQSVRRNYAKFTQFDIAQKEVIDRIGGSIPEERLRGAWRNNETPRQTHEPRTFGKNAVC